MQRARLAQPSRRVERCSERHFAPPERPAATAPSLSAQPARVREFQWAAHGRRPPPPADRSHPPPLSAERIAERPHHVQQGCTLSAHGPRHSRSPRAGRRCAHIWPRRRRTAAAAAVAAARSDRNHEATLYRDQGGDTQTGLRARYEACSACSHPNARLIPTQA